MDDGTAAIAIAPTPPGPAERPWPSAPSLVGAAGGVLLAASHIALLAEMAGGDHYRAGGLLLSLAFLALGIILMRLHRNRRAVTAGVALSAFAVSPLLLFVFVDVDDPGSTFGDFSSFGRIQTEIAVVSAIIWLIAYVWGPGRRHGLYLGLALLAIWSVANIQITSNWFEDAFGVRQRAFVSIDDNSSSGSSSFDDSQFEDDYYDDYSYDEPDDPATELGIASLVFGAAYLAIGSRLDRKGELRAATPFFAVSLPILTLGVLYLSDPLHAWGASLLGLAIAALAVRFALPRHRRFSTWFATGAAVFATFVFVLDGVGDSARASGLVFGALGLVLALFAGRADDGLVPPATAAAGPDPGTAGLGTDAGGPTTPWMPVTASADPTFSGGLPSAPPEAAGPSIDPSGPTGAAFGAPAFEAPPAAPWARPTEPVAAPQPVAAPEPIAPEPEAPAPDPSGDDTTPA